MKVLSPGTRSDRATLAPRRWKCRGDLGGAVRPARPAAPPRPRSSASPEL